MGTVPLAAAMLTAVVLLLTTMKGRPKKKAPAARRISVRERAYRHIQDIVTTGRLPAGSPISELQLARDLGSSRTPIREAMNQLAAEGMLEQAAGGGMVVAQFTREGIQELYELREALEVFAVAGVANRSLLKEDRLRLQALVDEIAELQRELTASGQESLGDDQMQRFFACDLGFHALLISMTNNGRMQKIIHETRLLISVFASRRRGHDVAALESIRQYHQDILNAVQERNVAVATRAVAEHIRASCAERLQEYDYWRREQALKQTVPALFTDRRKLAHA